jgi:hypothetical protein
MADGRRNNGGNKNAGRKPKADEQKLIERLTPLEDTAYKALKEALKDSEGWAVKLFMEYRYGKPKQSIEQKTTHTVNDFNIKDVLGFDKSE